MNTNEQLIHTFYTAFEKKDFKTMQLCYADNAVFSDAVFKNLKASEVKAMWHMLCENGKDLEISFSNLASQGNAVTCRWEARYTFSLTGKKVHNAISASFEIQNGKIVNHIDRFSFWRWSSMALGLAGKLLGWTPFLNKKVSATAMRNLRKFMDKNYRSFRQVRIHDAIGGDIYTHYLETLEETNNGDEFERIKSKFPPRI